MVMMEGVIVGGDGEFLFNAQRVRIVFVNVQDRSESNSLKAMFLLEDT
jgi:hypothetical protein